MTSRPEPSPDSTSDLPVDVLAAIHRRRKIEAIKLLRNHRGLGLKEAKHVIDDYLIEHPHLMAGRSDRAESGLGRLLAIVFIAAVAYGAYRLLVGN